MLFPFICGTAVVVMPRFDPIEFFSNIEKYKITIAMVVPPVLVLVAKHSGRLFHESPFSCLSYVFISSCRQVRFLDSQGPQLGCRPTRGVFGQSCGLTCAASSLLFT